jgi:hypothetical protein
MRTRRELRLPFLLSMLIGVRDGEHPGGPVSLFDLQVAEQEESVPSAAARLLQRSARLFSRLARYVGAESVGREQRADKAETE